MNPKLRNQNNVSPRIRLMNQVYWIVRTLYSTETEKPVKDEIIAWNRSSEIDHISAGSLVKKGQRLVVRQRGSSSFNHRQTSCR